MKLKQLLLSFSLLFAFNYSYAATKTGHIIKDEIDCMSILFENIGAYDECEFGVDATRPITFSIWSQSKPDVRLIMHVADTDYSVNDTISLGGTSRVFLCRTRGNSLIRKHWGIKLKLVRKSDNGTILLRVSWPSDVKTDDEN